MLFSITRRCSLRAPLRTSPEASRLRFYMHAAGKDDRLIIQERQQEASTRPPRFYCEEPILPLHERPGTLSTSSQPTASPTPRSATYLIEGDEAKHMIKSLRLKEGDAVEMCDGRGGIVQCVLSGIESNKGKWRACATEASAPRHEAWKGPSITLAVACLTLKGGRSEWLVEKATELGAREFQPLITERSSSLGLNSKFKTSKGRQGSEDGGAGSREEDDKDEKGRLDRVTIAATKQSLRSHAMVMHHPMNIEQLVAMIREADVALLAAAGAPPALSVLTEKADQESLGGSDEKGRGVRKTILIVGPEGDFSPKEVHLLMEAGARAVGLGESRLRTETAAIALLSLAMLS